ncbi:hypothetical protein BD414DRAFT_498293 [Trametes punicea]|nr:hypothetical protein BD414DRAFT_498293 [Trametes punicea]
MHPGRTLLYVRAATPRHYSSSEAVSHLSTRGQSRPTFRQERDSIQTEHRTEQRRIDVHPRPAVAADAVLSLYVHPLTPRETPFILRTGPPQALRLWTNVDRGNVPAGSSRHVPRPLSLEPCQAVSVCTCSTARRVSPHADGVFPVRGWQMNSMEEVRRTHRRKAVLSLSRQFPTAAFRPLVLSSLEPGHNTT